ncbi:MAG: MurT ligase domain-containing protein [Clostridiales bacterium]|nr:MurT ligase domain-containing protein [Clostridiales bacterium]
MLRLLGRKGTYFAGKLAIKLCPDFIGRIGRPKTLIGVTGTNGKTTVSNMLNDVFASWGIELMNNRYGSNINAGVASALIESAGISGKCKKDIGVLEIDERSARLIYPYLKPDYLLITNLFRDSMRRNAHPEYIADILSKYIPKESKLILNADDLISSSVAPGNDRCYFGISRLDNEPEARENIVQDVRICPNCAERLVFDFRRYNHIGQAHCPACGFSSPTPDYLLESIDFDSNIMRVKEAGATHDYKLVANAVYNIYNSLSVVALLRDMGYPAEKIASAFDSLKVVQSRFWEEEINGEPLTVIMAKGLNAVACTRSFDYVSSEDGKKAVVLMLDDVFDEKESSENIAWLYDADFEFLNDPNIIQIVTVGVRSLDSRMRLLMAGVPEEKIVAVRSEKDAAGKVDIAGADKIFLLYELYRYDSAVAVRNRIAERMKEVQA